MGFLFGAYKRKPNCSTGDFLQNRCKEYKGYLKSPNYPVELVDKQFDKALSIPKAELLRKKVKPAKKVFHWCSTTIQFCQISKKLSKSTFVYYNSHQKSKKFFHPSRYFPLIAVEPKILRRCWRHQNFG